MRFGTLLFGSMHLPLAIGRSTPGAAPYTFDVEASVPDSAELSRCTLAAQVEENAE
jgi:hypothetical protein